MLKGVITAAVSSLWGWLSICSSRELTVALWTKSSRLMNNATVPPTEVDTILHNLTQSLIDSHRRFPHRASIAATGNCCYTTAPSVHRLLSDEWSLFDGAFCGVHLSACVYSSWGELGVGWERKGGGGWTMWWAGPAGLHNRHVISQGGTFFSGVHVLVTNISQFG